MLIALFRWWRHVFLTVRDAQERHVFKRIRRRWFGGRRNWRDWDDATEKSARISDVRNCDVSSVSVLRLGWNDLSQLFRRFFRQRRSFKFVVLKIIRIQIKNTIHIRVSLSGKGLGPISSTFYCTGVLVIGPKWPVTKKSGYEATLHLIKRANNETLEYLV